MPRRTDAKRRYLGEKGTNTGLDTPFLPNGIICVTLSVSSTFATAQPLLAVIPSQLVILDYTQA